MAGQGAGLGGHAFLVTAITHDHVGVVINELGVGLVVLGGQVSFGNRQTDGTGDAGAEGPGGYLYPGGFKGFRVAGGVGAPLAELLDVFNRYRVVTAQVQQRIKQHAAVASREHKAVAVEPLGILRVMAQDPVPQGIGHGGAAHGQAGVAGV